MYWRFAALSLSLSFWVLFEEFVQQFVLEQCDGTIAVMLELYPEEGICRWVQGKLVVFVNIDGKLINVTLLIAEYQGVVDVQDDECLLIVVQLVKEAVIHWGHGVAFLDKSIAVVSVEVAAGVGEAVQALINAVELVGVEIADLCNESLELGEDWYLVGRTGYVQVSCFDISCTPYHLIRYC